MPGDIVGIEKNLELLLLLFCWHYPDRLLFTCCNYGGKIVK